MGELKHPCRYCLSKAKCSEWNPTRTEACSNRKSTKNKPLWERDIILLCKDCGFDENTALKIIAKAKAVVPHTTKPEKLYERAWNFYHDLLMAQ